MNKSNTTKGSKYSEAGSASTSDTGCEWSEHISSSGKKYYYNSVSEVSQWEKPREWRAENSSSKDSLYGPKHSMCNFVINFINLNLTVFKF